MSYENVDKDPDLRKRSDLGPISRPWVPLVLVIGGAFIAVALVVLAGWAGIEWFGWTAGNNANSDKAAAAGAWASAVGATALALASVWIAMQANKHAREAEQRASEEAALTAQRHREEIEAAENRLQAQLDAAAAQSAHDTQVAEDRHARELEAANARADRQIKAEWYREQAQVVRDLWGTVNKATVPTLMLAQRIDEHNAFYQKISSDTLAREPLVSKVSNAYTTWWTHYLDVQGAIAVAEMLIEDQVIRGQLNTLRDRVEDHMRYAMLYKEAAINNGGGAGVSTFPATINGFIKLRDPMMSEIHRLLTSTDGQHV